MSQVIFGVDPHKLSRAHKRGYRDLVAKACFEHASTRP